MKDLSNMSYKEASDSIESEFKKMGLPASGFGEISVVKDEVKYTLVANKIEYLDWQGKKTIVGTKDAFDYEGFISGSLAIHKAGAKRSKFELTTWKLEKKSDELLVVDHPKKVSFLTGVEKIEEPREDGINVKSSYVSDGSEIRVQGQRILIEKGTYNWEKFNAFSDWGDSKCGGHFS